MLKTTERPRSGLSALPSEGAGRPGTVVTADTLVDWSVSSPPQRGSIVARPSRARGKSTKPRDLLAHPLVRWVPLGGILAVQAWNAVGLAHSNTAFEDEATYLVAGHQILQGWLHGGPDLYFPTYFSGAPVIYPVVGALFDSIGGLIAARALSMGFMLIATVLVYASTRRLFGTQAGWLAAGAFSLLSGTQFLSALATYDAMSLMLIATAAWIVIRAGTSGRRDPYGAIYLAAPVLALANATKYASTLYDLVVIALAYFVVLTGYRRTQALRTAAVLFAITLAIDSALLAFAGPSYLAGITETTLSRAPGTDLPSIVVHDVLSWVGAVILMAAIAAIGLVIGALRGGVSWPKAGMGIVLASAVILAPANQIRIHTTTSLFKHVDFGAWFGAILVGYLFSLLLSARPSGLHSPRYGSWRRLSGRAFRYPLAGATLLSLLLVGSHQVHIQYRTWPNSSQFDATLRPLVFGSSGQVLVDAETVPAYYLGDYVKPTRWSTTFYFRYLPPHSKTALTGIPAFQSAISHSYFSVVALDWSTEKTVDSAVAKAMHYNRRYHFVTTVPLSDVYGRSAFVIWRLEPSSR